MQAVVLRSFHRWECVVVCCPTSNKSLMKTYVGCDLSALACVVHNTCALPDGQEWKGRISGYYNFMDNNFVEGHHQPSVSLWHPTLGFVYLVAYQSHKSQETNLWTIIPNKTRYVKMPSMILLAHRSSWTDFWPCNVSWQGHVAGGQPPPALKRRWQRF